MHKKYKTIIKQRTTVVPEIASILVKGRYIRYIIISHGRDSNQISFTVNDIINFIDIIVSCDDIFIERKGKTIKFIKYDNYKMILFSVNVKDGNVRMKTYYKILEDKACDVHTDFSAAPQFTSKNVPYCPQLNSKYDTNQNMLQDKKTGNDCTWDIDDDSILSGSKEPDIILNYHKNENEDFICNLFVINHYCPIKIKN